MRPVHSRRQILSLTAAGLATAGCAAWLPGMERPVVAAPYTPVAAKGYPADGFLIDADWLAARQDDSGVRLVDLSPWRRFRAGHVPGALHLWWQDTMELHNDIYGMLVGSPQREELIGRLGIAQDTTVVAYDDEGGLWAARLLWLLDYLGHQRLHLLDGGPQAWLAAGRALATDAARVAPAVYQPSLRPERILSHAEIARISAAGDPLIDGRNAAETTDTWRDQLRLGRVAGAAALPWPENLIAPAGPFLPADRLHARYAALLDRGGRIAVYGLFGARAAHPYAALRALGHTDIGLYDGSWAEWGRRPDLPHAVQPPLPVAPL